MKLNEQQEAAANHVDGPCLVTACPGSGKTRTVVERTARLIAKGIKPNSIMCITFTNKAAEEMRERLEKRLGEDAHQLWISTFHRLGSTVIRKQGVHIGYKPNVTICAPDDQIDLMAQAARQLGHELTKPEIKKIVWQVNDSRENLETDAELEKRLNRIDEAYYDIAREYLDRLIKSNMVDLTGILSETVRLFTSAPEVLARIHRRYRYFMVDETQDTNGAQFKIVELLGKESRNVFIVGDPDQSIYGWRGARAENLNDFQKVFPELKIYKLGKNYRSTPQIIKVADKLIRYNPERIDVEFTTDNPNGPPVVCKGFQTPEHEAMWVAEQINMLTRNGAFKKSEIAVFYRINSMSRALEMAMLNKGVAYNVIGNFSFFDRKEVKDAIAMLRFLVNPHDGIAFSRFANKPKRHLGDTTIGKIENFAKAHTEGNVLEAAKRIGEYVKSEAVQDGVIEIIKVFDRDWTGKTTAEVLNTLLTELKYEEYLKVEDDETFEDRKENLAELVKDAARFSEQRPTATIGDYVESLSLMTDADAEQEEDAVAMMSLHASKGLEFPVVFMVGVEDGVLPHDRAVSEREDGLFEERRLCYVGMTRAMKILTLSYCVKRQQGAFAQKGQVRYKPSTPSPFLEEAGLIKIAKAVAKSKVGGMLRDEELPPNFYD